MPTALTNWLAIYLTPLLASITGVIALSIGLRLAWLMRKKHSANGEWKGDTLLQLGIFICLMLTGLIVALGLVGVRVGP